jgi:hypothetical protein
MQSGTPGRDHCFPGWHPASGSLVNFYAPPGTGYPQLAQPVGLHTYLSIKFLLSDSFEKVYAMCNVSTDITVRKQAEEVLRYQSLRDLLTNLFNRRYLEEVLGRELRRANRKQNPIAW